VVFACKYANNILKNFACTLSIVLSTIIIAIWFPEHSALSLQFILGATMVMGSTYAYGAEDAKAKEEPKAEYKQLPVDEEASFPLEAGHLMGAIK